MPVNEASSEETASVHLVTDDTPDAGNRFIDEPPIFGRRIPRRRSAATDLHPLRRIVLRLWEIVEHLATEERKLWSVLGRGSRD